MALIETPWIGRRAVITQVAATAAVVLVPSAPGIAQQGRIATPRQTEGPYYPVAWSGDVDNDLVVVRGEAAKAIGQIAYVDGKVLDLSGNPIAGANVEIWQCDARGVYRHPRDESPTRRRDAGFQGHGRTKTDNTGRYSFRTIRPATYPGRTPHIHFKVERPGAARLVTQLYVFGEPQNERDGVLNAIRDPRQRDSVIARFDPADGREPGALAATFDIVVA